MLCCLLVVLFFFFFKQKTAYEMRISDWSSDVCSSDLSQQGVQPSVLRVYARFLGFSHGSLAACRQGLHAAQDRATDATQSLHQVGDQRRHGQGRRTVEDAGRAPSPHRSEEHTSELQSLMRISYAVFCLKNTT